MYDTIREAAFGQFVRWATNKRYFKYDEELEGFQIPWQSTTEEKSTSEPAAQTVPDSDSSSTVSSLTRVKTENEQRAADLERSDLEQTQSTVIVPTKTKDGVILVDWYTTDDQANPQNWSTGKKVWVSFVVFIYTLVVYASSSIYTSAQPQVMEYFGLTYAEGSAILSLYVAGYGLGPLLFSPLSEIPFLGRNIPYVVSFALFVILAVPTALVDNYAGLLVLRFLTGFMGSPCLATGGATVGDIFDIYKLPYGLVAWVAAAFNAPAIGPVLSGFAVPVLGWRWAFWEILIMSAPVFVVWFFFMPETSADNILLRRARRLRAITGDSSYVAKSEIDQASKTSSAVIYEALLTPFLITVKDPAVLFTNLFTSFCYGVYYSFFEAFPLSYIAIYNFNIGEMGVVFAGAIVPGSILGILIYVSYQWFYFEPRLRRFGLGPQEERLIPAIIAVWALPIGLFWYGWSSSPNVHWIASIFGIMFFCTGAFVMFQGIFMYLPLTYPKYAASLFAMNDAFRSALAAGSIIFAHPLYQNLGVNKGVSILASVMFLGSFGVVALWWFGAKLRAKSKFTGE